MRRFLSSLLLLTAFAGATTSSAQILPVGGGGGSGGVGSSATAQYPFSGTIVLTIDDGLEGTHSVILPLLEEVNADSGLAGTPWQLHANSFVNIRGQGSANNGLRGYLNATGSANSMTVDQVLDLDNSGLFEVGLHGFNHGIMDPSSTPSPFRLKAPWQQAGASPESTTAEQIIGGWKALVDTIGMNPNHLHSFVTPGHKLDLVGAYYMAKYFKNCRSGNIQIGGALGDTTQYPRRTTAQTTNVSRGTVLQWNYGNNDPLAYMLGNFDSRIGRMYTPFFPVNRMWTTYLDTPSNGSGNAAETTNVNDHRFQLAAIASMKGLGVWTWHDQWNDPPAAATQSLGGAGCDTCLVGVERIFRTAAHYARNGLLNRDGPKLQMMKFNDAMNKANAATAHIDGAINCVDNFRLEIDSLYSTTVPYGYPLGLAQVWADSGWTFRTKAANAAAGGWFGYYDDSGSFSTTDAGDAANFKSLIGVWPVPPRSTVRVSCFASTEETPETTAVHDSLSAAWINIEVTPIRFDRDPTDSTGAWVRSALTTDAGFIQVDITDPYNVALTSDYDGPNAGDGWTGAGSPTSYGQQRYEHRFHTRDQWRTFRSAGYSNAWYANGSANTTADRDQRWRPFWRDVVIPEDCHAVRVRFIPTGWTNSTSDSLMIAGIELQAVAR